MGHKLISVSSVRCSKLEDCLGNGIRLKSLSQTKHTDPALWEIREQLKLPSTELVCSLSNVLVLQIYTNQRLLSESFQIPVASMYQCFAVAMLHLLIELSLF